MKRIPERKDAVPTWITWEEWGRPCEYFFRQSKHRMEIYLAKAHHDAAVWIEKEGSQWLVRSKTVMSPEDFF
jgi:hypothetical protein